MGNKRAARYGPGDFVHFRTDKALKDDLDQIVQEAIADGRKATRSSVARTLLRQALDKDPTHGETLEVLANVHRATQMAMNRLTDEVTDKLPRYLDDAVNALNGSSSAE